MGPAETAGAAASTGSSSSRDPGGPAPKVGSTSRGERWAVVALVLVAMAHNLIFVLGYPFFCSLDEQMHLDVIVKVARGYWPRAPHEGYDRETMIYLVGFGTFEYFNPPTAYPGERHPPPLWTDRTPAGEQRMRGLFALWERAENVETHAPQIYYGLAALWWKLLGAAGLTPAYRLYGMRLLSTVLLGLGVLLTWRLARRVAPGRAEVTVGAPLLLALWPLDVLAFINSDTLSPVVATAALLAALAWRRRTEAAVPLAIAAGLLAAAAALTKLSNAAIGLVLALVVGSVVLSRGASWSRRLGGALALAVAALPLGAWLTANRLLLGDWTGTASKVVSMGWKPASLAAKLAHPLWTPAGAWTFLRETLAELWRGGGLWLGQPFTRSPLDAFFVGSSLLCLLVAAVGGWRHWRRLPAAGPAAASREPTLAALACWTLLLGMLGTLAYLSLQFVFTPYNVPSTGHPFFSQGRLLAGALPAFLVLYADGAGRLARRVPGLRPSLVPLVVGLLAVGAQAAFTWPVFSSPYNFFHLP